MSISIEELNSMNPDSYQIIDIRDEAEIGHGAIPGAVAVATEEIEGNEKIDFSKKLVICCSRGKYSVDVAEELSEKGIDAESLEGGYIAWLIDNMKQKEAAEKAGEGSFAKDVEQSLRKKFRKSIWCKFTKAINEYELVKPGDKIALGHHYDDVIETILMGMLYSAQFQTMMPKLHSTNFEGMELIRPLYLVREDAIKAWRDYNDLHFIQCACKFTDTCTTCNNEENQSKRMETKELIARLKKVNPYVEGNIFKSVENVNLDTIVAYKQKGVKHHFLDEYDR